MAGEIKKISVVVPAYNSGRVLNDLFVAIDKVFTSINTPYQLVLVDDCSQDNTWDVIKELKQRNPAKITAIGMAKNFSQHNAIFCGLHHCTGDLIITMDDDLQHPPEEIPRLLARLDEGFDVVYGAPEREQNGLMRALASRITRLALCTAIDNQVAKNVSPFRIFRTQLREAFAGYESPFVSIDVLLTWATTRFSAITVAFQPRHSGSSNYTFTKLVRHAFNMMTGFSTAPLQLASLIGFVCTLFGIGVFFYVFVRYCLEGSVPGFPFLASIIAIFSGAQLFALGVMGEYLARMHFRSMKRPPYVVRTTT